MKNIIVLILSIVCLNTFSQTTETYSKQNERLDINYGLFKTSYYSNKLEVGMKEFKSILFTNEEAKSLYKQGKTYSTFGYIIGTPSMILLLVQLSDIQNNPPITGVFIGSIVGTTGGFLLDYIGKTKVKKSISIYNNEMINTTFNIKPNGVGLALNF